MSGARETDHIEVDDCWNRIGVRGTKECPKLVRYVHCYNCDVYERAGRLLLNREPPSGYVQEWTRLLATPKEETRSGLISILIFRIGPEWLALPTRLFDEILVMQEMHTLPDRGSEILRGMINVRGEMRLCFALGKLLGIDRDFLAAEGSDSKLSLRALLISMPGEHAVFFANQVFGTHLYHPDELQPLPATLPRQKNDFSKGILSWNEKHVALLDEASLFEKLMGSLR